MTNYEKIKAMSVEKMVECIHNFNDEIFVKPCSKKYCSCFTDGLDCKKKTSESECKQATKNWLESEEVQNDKS